MKLQDYRETFYIFSGKASDLNRQLAFAGIAVIWLFKKDASGGTPTVPGELVFPTLLLVASLAFDMMQYCVASMIWRSYYRSKEKEGASEKKDLPLHPERLELPIWFFFFAKIIALFAAYGFIGSFLFHTWTTTASVLPVVHLHP